MGSCSLREKISTEVKAFRMTENAVDPIREHKVIIIGAGMAGLSAANHLNKNGLTDFKILEARSRIGGRIVSIDIGPQKVTRLRYVSVTLLFTHNYISCIASDLESIFHLFNHFSRCIF